jgi:hypothetical protein
MKTIEKGSEARPGNKGSRVVWMVNYRDGRFKRVPESDRLPERRRNSFGDRV